MRSWIQVVLFAAGLVVAAMAGCGGNVVVDGKPGAGGDGGGGAGGYPATTNDAITVTSTSTVTNTSTGTTTSFDVTATTTTGPTMTGCDNTGMCGENGNDGCIGCAISFPCAELYNECFSGGPCTEYAECLNDCMNPSCQDQCGQQFPEGAEQYQVLISCVICDACPNDCAQYTGFCSN